MTIRMLSTHEDLEEEELLHASFSREPGELTFQPSRSPLSERVNDFFTEPGRAPGVFSKKVSAPTFQDARRPLFE
jgi:hypothetical protein